MKFTVTMKDPDGPYESIDDAVEQLMKEQPPGEFDDADAIRKQRRRKLDSFTAKWLQYGEYVTLEFDTDTNTCTVVQQH